MQGLESQVKTVLGHLRIVRLETHVAVELLVVGAIDFAHPPGADAVENLVAAGKYVPQNNDSGGRFEGLREGAAVLAEARWLRSPGRSGPSRGFRGDRSGT